MAEEKSMPRCRSSTRTSRQKSPLSNKRNVSSLEKQLQEVREKRKNAMRLKKLNAELVMSNKTKEESIAELNEKIGLVQGLNIAQEKHNIILQGQLEQGRNSDKLQELKNRKDALQMELECELGSKYIELVKNAGPRAQKPEEQVRGGSPSASSPRTRRQT